MYFKRKKMMFFLIEESNQAQTLTFLLLPCTPTFVVFFTLFQFVKITLPCWRSNGPRWWRISFLHAAIVSFYIPEWLSTQHDSQATPNSRLHVFNVMHLKSPPTYLLWFHDFRNGWPHWRFFSSQVRPWNACVLWFYVYFGNNSLFISISYWQCLTNTNLWFQNDNGHTHLVCHVLPHLF